MQPITPAGWSKQPVSREDLVKKIAGYESVFLPGKKAEYSNSNYILLSLIIEKIEGQSYADVVKKRILSSANLENTYYGGKIDPANNEALSYTKKSNWQLATETDMSVPLGAGSMVSTPTDLNNFLGQLFAAKLVSLKTLEMMMTLKDGFGIGMFQVPFYEKKAFGHTGGIDGFRSNAFYFPEEKASIAITANGVVMPLNDILIGVLSIYFNRDYDLPEFSPSLQLSPAELTRYLGVYASTTFPLKITITKEGSVLYAQATGQPSFPLEAFEQDKFKYEQAKLEMVFVPDEGKMIFKQAGMTFELTKE